MKVGIDNFQNKGNNANGDTFQIVSALSFGLLLSVDGPVQGWRNITAGTHTEIVMAHKEPVKHLKS